MSSFEETLKRAVFGVTEAYKIAENDLYDETAIASESVHKITDGLASLILDKEREGPTRTVFSLYLKSERGLDTVTYFSVLPNGYPIKVADTIGYLDIESYQQIIESRSDIRKYFDSLAANPSSRLVIRIAFLLRTLKAEQIK